MNKIQYKLVKYLIRIALSLLVCVLAALNKDLPVVILGAIFFLWSIDDFEILAKASSRKDDKSNP